MDDPTPRPPPCVAPLLRAGDRLPSRFVRRDLTIAPGERHPYVAAEWADTLVVVEDGTVELEGLTGRRWRLARGAVLWLVGLPLRAVHNVGPRPAVLVAVSRRLPNRR